MACLTSGNCRTITYAKSTGLCQLFVDIPSQYGSLVAQTGYVTLTVIDARRLSPPLFPVHGVTVAGHSDGTSGNTNNALTNPWGLAITTNNLLYVSDLGNYRIMKMKIGNLTGSVAAGTTGVSGSTATTFSYQTEIAVDAASNIYIADTNNCRVMLWRNNSSSGVVVGGNGTCGSSAMLIAHSVGLAVDSQGNIYVAETDNHRVTKWAVNATSGVVIAGITGVSGSDSQHLYSPYGLYLDESHSYLYIADYYNYRIQRYRIDIPSNGTTVAGGNGYGSASNQLNQPYDVCVSKKTGDIYIADKANHRIQRWSVGATSAITIVGTTGVSGTNATQLNGPSNVILDMNETFLYVSDIDNHRVQQYQLP
ncbi:unnamed protein product [Adineta steineri]|uniref:NHL repeat containing protein-like protein n=1 Tax=Adineta steineri TaxID=433720 RepID=A0A816A0I8_9BILA|nr:unnamed protein product [Adineta steineri]CAF1591732.1 unnamed protein product [Adineta steineri]